MSALVSHEDIDRVVNSVEAALDTLEDMDDDRWYLQVELSRRYRRQKPAIPDSTTNGAGQQLVYVECFDGNAPGQFHRVTEATVNEGERGYTPTFEEVLTIEARARDLGKTPCSTCYPETLEEGGENERMDVTYFKDEKGGLHRRIKSTLYLGEVSSSKPEVVEALILIAVLSLVVSRALRQLFVEIVAYNQDSDDEREPSSLLPRRRWSKVFNRYSAEILRRVARRLGYESPHLVGLMFRDALDPNQHRPSLLEDVQHGEFAYELA